MSNFTNIISDLFTSVNFKLKTIDVESYNGRYFYTKEDDTIYMISDNCDVYDKEICQYFSGGYRVKFKNDLVVDVLQIKKFSLFKNKYEYRIFVNGEKLENVSPLVTKLAIEFMNSYDYAKRNVSVVLLKRKIEEALNG